MKTVAVLLTIIGSMITLVSAEARAVVWVGPGRLQAITPNPLTYPVWLTFRAASHGIDMGPASLAPSGYVLEYASLKAFKVDAPTLLPGTVVMLDLELADRPWRIQAEALMPRRTVRRFIALAHTDGLKAWIAAGRAIRNSVASIPADGFIAILPNVTVARMRYMTKQITMEQSGRVFVEVSANGHKTAGQMVRLCRAALPWTHYFGMWGGLDGATLTTAALVFKRLA